MNFGNSEEALSCSFEASGYQSICNPSLALHYNIPLWYSAPGDYDVIDSAHHRLREKRVFRSDIGQVTMIEIHCIQPDTARQECLRLNFGVTISSSVAGLDSCSSLQRRHLFLPTSPKEKVTFSDLQTDQSREDIYTAVSYSVEIPEGQDPEAVFIGWTTAGFRYINSQFQGERASHSQDIQYGQQVKVVKRPTHGQSEYVSTYSTSFLVCLADLMKSPVPSRLSVSVR